MSRDNRTFTVSNYVYTAFFIFCLLDSQGKVDTSVCYVHYSGYPYIPAIDQNQPILHNLHDIEEIHLH